MFIVYKDFKYYRLARLVFGVGSIKILYIIHINIRIKIILFYVFLLIIF